MNKRLNFITPNNRDFNFHLLYDEVVIYKNWTEKIYLGSKFQCRFCGTNNPIDFKQNTSHTFPELTGNKWLFSNDECKRCNEIFGKYETSLGDHSHLMRTLLGIGGKKGTPTFKTMDEAIRISSDGKTITMKVHSEKAKRQINSGHKIEIDSKQPKIILKNNPYIPLHLFKSLCKIAYSIMPESELQGGEFKNLIPWLLDKNATSINDHDAPYYQIAFGTLSTFTKVPGLFLYKRKKLEMERPIPKYSFVFKNGLYVYQIFLPYCASDISFFENELICMPIHYLALSVKGNKFTLQTIDGTNSNKTYPGLTSLPLYELKKE